MQTICKCAVADNSISWGPSTRCQSFQPAPKVTAWQRCNGTLHFGLGLKLGKMGFKVEDVTDMTTICYVTSARREIQFYGGKFQFHVIQESRVTFSFICDT